MIDLATGWKIDFIIRKSREYSRTEFARRQLIMFEGLNLYIATAEDVLLSKLEWAKLGQSGRQVEDAAWLLRRRRDDLDRGYIERWVEELQVGGTPRCRSARWSNSSGARGSGHERPGQELPSR